MEPGYSVLCEAKPKRKGKASLGCKSSVGKKEKLRLYCKEERNQRKKWVFDSLQGMRRREKARNICWEKVSIQMKESVLAKPQCEKKIEY